jgi:hypothetical protein
MEGTHIVDKAARDRGRQFNWFRHVPDIVDLTAYCESGGSADNPPPGLFVGGTGTGGGWQVMVMGDSLPCTMTLAR